MGVFASCRAVSKEDLTQVSPPSPRFRCPHMRLPVDSVDPGTRQTRGRSSRRTHNKAPDRKCKAGIRFCRCPVHRHHNLCLRRSHFGTVSRSNKLRPRRACSRLAVAEQRWLRGKSSGTDGRGRPGSGWGSCWLFCRRLGPGSRPEPPRSRRANMK